MPHNKRYWLGPFIFCWLAATCVLPAQADVATERVGIVVMHGKGGSPTKHVAELAAALAQGGWLVANLEMPWSGRREYDVDVATAEKEVNHALAELRNKGATRLFVAGQSQGGLFALYFGGRQIVDGIIAIAPGGNVGSPLFREKLGESVELARKLLAEGKGDEKARLADHEGARGVYPVVTTPRNYLPWFEPDGAMNQLLAARRVKPETPVLFIVPTSDYPGLLRFKQQMFDALPKNPNTLLYEPSATHLGAPSASADRIFAWVGGLPRASAKP